MRYLAVKIKDASVGAVVRKGYRDSTTEGCNVPNYGLRICI
jgi:hypothetical protein